MAKLGDDKENAAKLKKIDLSRSRRFPNFIEAYLNYAKEQESTEKIHRWTAISIIAAALERKVWLKCGFFPMYPNFYIFIIGNSGEVRKSTSTGLGVNLLKQVPGIHLMSERVTDRSLIDQLKRSASTYLIENKEFKQSAIFCYASELSVFMQETGNTISALLTTFWDNPPDWTYELKGDGRLQIEKPCINFLGASTPTWLQRSIPVEDMEGGLTSRIIFVVELNPPDHYNPWPFKSYKPEMEKDLVLDLKQIHALSGEFSCTPEADIFYDKWYRAHKAETRSITDIRFKGYHSRKSVTVWKLAMVLAVAEGNKLVFEKRHFETALEYLSEIERPMLDAFGPVGDNKLAKGIDKIRSAAKHLGKVPLQVVYNLCWRDYTGNEIRQILQDLEGMRDLRRTQNGSDVNYEWIGS